MKQGTLFYDEKNKRYDFHYIDGNGASVTMAASSTLGHRAFTGPRASPLIDDRLDHPLLHI